MKVSTDRESLRVETVKELALTASHAAVVVATARFESAYIAYHEARRDKEEALKNLSLAQGGFDDIVREVKNNSPSGSSWNQNGHHHYQRSVS